jgi:glycosyltransferase involved in cell wall biosynthesis
MPIYVRSKRRAPEPIERAAAAEPSKGALPFGLPAPPPEFEQRPAGISLCMIVKNEERFLEQCLRSAQDAVDEIIVVDTGSTDRTVAIAKSFGATIVETQWRNDFAWARNQAIELATKRWILVLDADEELMARSNAALAQIRTAPAFRTALWTRLYNKSDDYQGTGAMSHALIRVFPNNPDIRYKGLIHEFPTIGDDPNGLKAVTSPIGIIHYGYVKEIVNSRDKGARNLAIVRASTERDPQDAYNWFNLGATAFLVEDFVTARDSLEHMRVLIGKQNRGFVPNGLSILAETYCDKLHDPVKGEEIARAALEFSPHYANAHFQLGKSLVAQKRFEEGRDAYRAAIDDGRFAAQQYVIDDQVYIWKAHSEIGSSYVIEGKDEAALEWFDKGLKNAPKAEPLHLNRAKACERLGRLEEARASFCNVYELHHTEQATLEYVNFLFRRGDDSEAVGLVDDTYSKFAPGTAVPMLMAAAAVAQKRNSPDDERYMRAAAALMPGASEVLDPLEATLRARGKNADLAELIANEETVEPRSAADYVRRVRRAIEAGRFEDALRLADAGLELAPANATLRYGAAVAEANLDGLERAIAHLEAIVEASADMMLLAAWMRASLLRNAGRFDEALAAIESVLAMDPNHVEALLVRAAVMEALGSTLGYEESLKRAFALDRQRVGLELSSFYLRSGRLEEAAAIAGQALG